MALTPKQEAFCQAMLTEEDQSAAYRKAYNPAPSTKAATIHRSAHELLQNPKIAARVAELRKPVVEAAQLTLSQHLEALFVLREAAVKEGKISAAVAAEIARGKACGHYIIKVEDVTDPLKKAMQNMTPEAAEKMLNALDQVEAAMRGKGKSARQPR